jgi:hypothetical protein
VVLLGTPILPLPQYLKADDIFMASLPPNIHTQGHKQQRQNEKSFKNKIFYLFIFSGFLPLKKLF